MEASTKWWADEMKMAKPDMEMAMGLAAGRTAFSQSGWERVHYADTSEYDATDVKISVWRLPVPGGWIYKVTELDRGHCRLDGKRTFFENHRSVSICFVPQHDE